MVFKGGTCCISTIAFGDSLAHLRQYGHMLSAYPSSLLYRGINIAFASMIHADVMIILVGLTLNISVFNEHI
jgi:hypothetical protein